MVRFSRFFFAIMIIAASMATACAAKAAPFSLVGTWKSNKLVYLFDANGSCTQIDLGHMGTYQNGKYTVSGDRLDIAFDSGGGLQYTFHRLKSGDLQVTDVITNNSFEFVQEH
jgi:hypothetical protein